MFGANLKLTDVMSLLLFCFLQSTEDGNKIVQQIMFTNVQWVNSGKYTCRARNGALDSEGTIIVEEQTIRLNVNFKFSSLDYLKLKESFCICREKTIRVRLF